jgi:molybdenum cofactor cytidylyltransferase
MKSSDYAIVILAAGKASRFGSAKQLATIQKQGSDITLVRKCLEMCLALSAPTYLVVGAYHDDILTHLGSDFTQVQIMQNENWENGLSSSIKVGVEAATSIDAHGVLFVAADQVAIETTDLRSLVTIWQSSPSQIVCAEYNEQPGIPALFPRSCFVRLAQLSGDKGAKSILNNSKHVRVVPMSNAALDIDTEDDLLRYQTGLPCSKA